MKMEIPLFVLVLQIGYAALNNRGHNGNPLILSARFVNSGQTRRLPDSDSFVPLSSRGIPASDSEQSDDDYSSFEDYSFRSVQSNQRRNDYLRYNTGPENGVSLESAPFSRINSNNYVDSLQSSSSLSRRTDPNFRRPFLRNGPSNLRQGPSSNYYRKVNDDLSLEVSSLEKSNPEDASRLREEASYLRSLLSLIEPPNNRRDQNRKYYRKANSISPDESPIDKLDRDEDAVNSLLSSPYWRRNYRKEYNNHKYDLPASRTHEPSPVKDIPDAYIDTILLVTDDDKPDEILIGRPELGSPEQHGDGLNLDDDVSNNLSPFGGLKSRLRSHKLTINDSPLTRKFNTKNNDNSGLESSLNDKLFSDDDKTGQLTLLRLASLENLNLDSSLLKSGDRKNHNNGKSNRRNFLRLSLSPNNKLTLDEGVASDLSELLSKALDELNLVPVTLRRSGTSNNKYSRRENNKLGTEEDNLSNIPVLRLGSVDVPNAELPVQRYHELVNRSNNRNLRKHGNNREALKKLFDVNLIDDFSDEFSLDTLFNFRNEDHDGRLDLDENFSSDLSALRSTNQDHLSLEPPLLRSSGENPFMAKDTDDTLHLEFPWNDALSSDNEKSSKLSALRSKSQLRNSKEKDNAQDTTDILHLEYPWNDALSSDNDKRSKVTALRSKSQLRNSKEKDNAKDATDTLDLEFPWNDALSSDNDNKSKQTALRSKSQLRNSKEKDNDKNISDVLHLEYPWNDALSSNNDIKSKQTALRSKSLLRNSKEKDNAKNTTDVLHLEYPWNDALSSDNDNKSKQTALRSKSLLRNSKEKDNAKNTTDVLHLEYPWNDALSADNDNKSKQTALRSKSLLRNSKEKDNAKDATDTLDLEYPWNDALSSDNDNKSKQTALRSKSQLRKSKEKDNAKNITDVLHLEYPWNDALSSDNDNKSKQTALRSKSLLRNSKEKNNAKNTTDVLHLVYPWNDALSSDNDNKSKQTALRSKSLLRNFMEKNNAKNTTDVLHLEYPWNDALSSDNDKRSKVTALRSKLQLRNSKEKDNAKDTSDMLRLEFPWNDALSPDKNKTGELKSQSLVRSQSDSRQDKEPKDELKLEFPWNDKSSPAKLSSKKTVIRTPDPFYVHPYLRNRNIKKHPNYFRRSYDEFTEGITLEKHKDGPSESTLTHSNRRFNDNRNLGVLPLAREDFENDAVFRDTDENPSAVITFPLDRRPERLRTQSRGTPLLLTTMERPNDTEFLLNLIGDRNDRKIYNDTIIFPKN